MSAIKDLRRLLQTLEPALSSEEFIFCSFEDGAYGDFKELRPICAYQEDEGLTLIVDRKIADRKGLEYSSAYRRITLQVHSSLDAVGLTAAVAGQLSDCGISANVVAAFHHDHIFVPAVKAASAMTALRTLQRIAKRDPT